MLQTIPTPQTNSQQQQLYTVRGERLRFTPHAGQYRAWQSQRRFVFVISGTQGGKTSFGPIWLDREIRQCGPGDYLAVTATFDLLKVKMLPELLSYWRAMRPDWVYHKAEKMLASPDEKSRVILRSADSTGGLESATAKAAWLDECGQPRFGLDAWEAVQRRLSLHQGRALGTTTPYNLAWLKTEVYDRWAAHDTDYDVVQFRSTQNPIFPKAEFARARRTLPDWKFRMFYLAEFTRPAGMIYDCFNREMNVCEPFAAVGDIWGGLDFGGVNTAALRVVEYNGIWYVTDEYLEGSRTAAEHYKALTGWQAGGFTGGSWSEGQWRMEFQAAGMPISKPPIPDVETGIQRVYSAMKEKRLRIFSTCRGLIDEIERYSRVVDAEGNPTQEIQDKRTFHRLDALRYIMSKLNGNDWLLA